MNSLVINYSKVVRVAAGESAIGVKRQDMLFGSAMVGEVLGGIGQIEGII